MAIYSHPVLRVDTDDVEGSVMFSPPTVGDNQLTLENIVIENDEINERIRDGRACYSLYIENSQSFFSRIFQFQKNKYNIFLNPKEYPQGKHTCNKRTSKTELMKEYPNIDFSYLESDEDEMWKINILESVEELLQRINKFYDWIEEYNKKYNYKNIALISHNGIISMMKDQKFNYQENGDEELKHCHPYKLRINLNSK